MYKVSILILLDYLLLYFQNGCENYKDFYSLNPYFIGLSTLMNVMIDY